MIFEVDTVKGFRDYFPPESLKKEEVRQIIENNFKLYGFSPLETPIIEFDELMKPDNLDSEDSAVSDRFRLKDRAGRNLGLRYEFTFQLARIFKQNPNIKLPLKRYQTGPLFRDEPIGPGRFRQFSQCDADIIGEQSINADAECLSLAADILKDLGIENAEIQINNRKLLAAIIESVEIKSAFEVMRELDKIDKIGEDAVKTNLKKYADTNQILTLFKLLEKDMRFFKENAFEGIQEIEELKKYCKLYGVKIIFNPFMIRGLSYYSGNIFEIKERGKPTIASGGRYDKVVGKYLQREIPATGISIGLERITELANISISPVPKLILISLNKDSEAISLAKRLRSNNISCLVMFEKAGKALEYANRYSIPYSLFVGEDEIKKKKWKIKNMKSGEEADITEKQLIKQMMQKNV